ncbi:MAG: hypothetical protein JJU18_06725 [Oceanicaulis sp.]|nr:hypothetical protein [Oceanicaulis sp.]
MSFLLDLLHLLIAALLAVLGFTYEREDSDCPPVRFEPAALYSAEADPFAMEPAVADSARQADWGTVSRECEPQRVNVTLPVL